MRYRFLDIDDFGVDRTRLSAEVEAFEVSLVDTVGSGFDVETDDHIGVADFDSLHLNGQLFVGGQRRKGPFHEGASLEVVVAAVDGEV